MDSSKTYEPSMDDVGFILRLECLAIDHANGTQLANITVTDAVITFPVRCPRCVIKIGSNRNLVTSISNPTLMMV